MQTHSSRPSSPKTQRPVWLVPAAVFGLVLVVWFVARSVPGSSQTPPGNPSQSTGVQPQITSPRVSQDTASTVRRERTRNLELEIFDLEQQIGALESKIAEYKKTIAEADKANKEYQNKWDNSDKSGKAGLFLDSAALGLRAADATLNLPDAEKSLAYSKRRLSELRKDLIRSRE